MGNDMVQPVKKVLRIKWHNKSTVLSSLRGRRKWKFLPLFSENIKAIKKTIIFLESCHNTAPALYLFIKRK
jgi:hypothetical protein